MGVGGKILVVGDVMLDCYTWGRSTRLSPEACAPVVLVDNETLAAGGAANVALNVSALGGRSLLVGLVGSDGNALQLADLVQSSCQAHFVRASSVTTVKQRVMVDGRQVFRVDREGTIDSSVLSEVYTSAVLPNLTDESIVLLSDYAKGFLTEEFLSLILAETSRRNILVIVDPKHRDFRRYAGAGVITPNWVEACSAANLPEDSSVERVGDRLLEYAPSILVTRGAEGMSLFQRGCSPFHLESQASFVQDVTGAGDTVVAALAVACSEGLSLIEAVKFATVAAARSVETLGTVAVSRHQVGFRCLRAS